ncbi:hypothetical protein PVAND_008560 [Polypedilum vanderplanki]|uniref:BTB domain-containing protein n=1 Tax=Polypedilum vanderplanki TaxID=319348 RepID=A0A9J6CAL1_POLVA|nr:hypothetical protein PVAND_008560 [Polypedilum vanderplanki]
MEQIVKFNFLYGIWNNTRRYICQIENQEIGSESPLKFVGKHADGKTNYDVNLVFFEKCKISKIPKGIMKTFPNSKILVINNSKLKTIIRDDLKENKNLEELYLVKNNITFLPGDLLKDLNKLTAFSVTYSKIELIEPNIFDKLTNLNCVDLSGNICIDKRFNSVEPNLQNATLDEIKTELQNIYPTWGDEVKNFKGEITSEVLKTLKEKNSIKKQKTEVKNKNFQLKSDFIQDFKAIMENEDFKDFTIKIGSMEFKAHKFVLVARSPTFANIIKENVHAEYLNLLDISTDIFQVILDFIYTDEFPENIQIDKIELFKVSERLKIEKLKNFAAEKLLDEINSENALEILKLSIKYKNDQLRQKSFEEIKKILDFIEIDDNLAFEPEKLEELIEIKNEKEQILREIEERFKNVLIRK